MVSWSEKRNYDKKRSNKKMAGGDWYDIGLQYVTLSCYLKSLPSRRRLLTSIEEWSVRAEPLLGPIPAFSAASICCNVFSLICSPAYFSVHCYFHSQTSYPACPTVAVDTYMPGLSACQSVLYLRRSIYVELVLEHPTVSPPTRVQP